MKVAWSLVCSTWRAQWQNWALFASLVAILVLSQISEDTNQLKSALWECSLTRLVVSSPMHCWHKLVHTDWGGGHQASADLIHSSGVNLTSHGTSSFSCWGENIKTGGNFSQFIYFLPTMNMILPVVVSSSYSSQWMLPLVFRPFFTVGFGVMFDCSFSCKSRNALTILMVLPYFG